MHSQASDPMHELQAVLARYDHPIDEPEAIGFIAKVREKGMIDDAEWKDVLRWLDDAMTYLEEGAPEDGVGRLDLDADPRDADWTRIVRARRLAGFRLPGWAALWLWWIGHDREERTWWKRIGAIAATMGFPRSG
jgi:hypothetical protein